MVIDFNQELSESSYLMYHLVWCFFPDLQSVEITKPIHEGIFHFRVDGEKKKYRIDINRYSAVPHPSKSGYFFYEVHLQNNFFEKYPSTCKELVTYETKRILLKRTTILHSCEFDEWIGGFFNW